jgi:thioredoxin 1
MAWSSRIVVSGSAVFLAFLASFAQANGAASFAPFEQWKAAVAAGDEAALSKLYSANPPAKVVVSNGNAGSLNDELQYWAGLKASGVTNFNPKVLSLEETGNQARLVLRVLAKRANENLVAAAGQVWVRQLDGWHIAASQRSDFHSDAGRRLPEPARPNASLYPPPGEAQVELKGALAEAARERKRVLVVFGANWCYDCHVLDTTFHSQAFAPLVQANYVVVHINIGDDGKDNNDLAAHLGVNLDRGIPSLAVLDSDGKVLVAQQNGEFESTVKIGPEDVKAFLEKWKPANKSTAVGKRSGM